MRPSIALRIGAFLIDAVMWLMIGLLFLCDWLTLRQRQRQHQRQQGRSTAWKENATKRLGVK
jgi:hypothetical protein